MIETQYNIVMPNIWSDNVQSISQMSFVQNLKMWYTPATHVSLYPWAEWGGEE